MKLWKGLVVSLAFASLVACSDQPNPEDAFKNYMDAWENQEFSVMYDLLSESSQGLMTEEEFVERYTTIYEDIQTEELTFTYELPEEEQEYDTEDSPLFDYEGSMESVAGPIDFAHEAALVYEEGEEEDRWAVDWSSSMIFPQMEQGDTVSVRRLAPERGEIFDVKGEGLAVNGTVNEVGINPGLMEQEEELKESLAKILDLSIEEIDQNLNQSWVGPDTFVPLAKLPENDPRLEDINSDNLPRGFQIRTGVEARVYPLGEAAGHLVGYMDDVTAEDLEELEGEGYRATDRIGRVGLEQVMEEELRGGFGWNVSIFSNDNESKELLAEKEPVDGEDVQLTISAEVQKSVHHQLESESGSAAAIHPLTGNVLALVSAPAYDPNAKTLGHGEEYVPNKFTKTYSPGSTFKPITASIGIEAGVIDPNVEMTIEGTTAAVGNYEVTRVEDAAQEEQVDLRDALLRSDNIYFARQALEIGGESFLQKTNEFGFGEDIPVVFPFENSQILNGNSFDNEALLADTGYGQGQIQMSTLHLAMTYTPFVTGGSLLKPTLLADEETGQVWHESVMSEETSSIVRERLQAVVQDPEGSGHAADIEGMSLAGKTGTAELKESLEEENGQNNGLFVAWDTEQQDLLVAMMIEDVGGSSYVLPKVKNIFESTR